ncbi:MAG: hypothetical protein WKF55_16075 [Gemmatimonadaceae bacterium]
MRATRLLLAGFLLAASAPAASLAQNAQQGRYFDDSWFWGLKGGVSTFTPTLGKSETAPTSDQINLNAMSAVFDPSAENSSRTVEVRDLRRIGVAALAFPKRFGRVRPYAGIGVSLNGVSEANPLLAADEDAIDDAVYERTDERRSQAGFLGMAGVQAQFQRLAVFGQASVVPGGSRFLLNDRPLGFFEAGVRYNFSGSREGVR